MNAQSNEATASNLLHQIDGVQRPTYQRKNLERSITHIGVGGFHRSHFASYIDQLCHMGETEWAIVGSGILPGDQNMAEALGSQDHLYTLIAKDEQTTDIRVVGSIVDYIWAFPDVEPLVEQLAHPDTQIVSLTLTESGYPIDSATGEYLPFASRDGQKNAFEIIAAGLRRRAANDAGPVTVMSFDNVASNGNVTRTATLGAAAELDPSLVQWISANVTFPNSMVDRITVQTTDTDKAWLAEQTGLIDAWPVKTEPFIQWTVEDNFAGKRLPLERLDVLVTDDVAPFEVMKLRLLNASHSCLAYVASLASMEHVHTALDQKWINDYVTNFLGVEARPSISGTGSLNLQDYCNTIVRRLENPEIADQVTRLSIDGSSKFHTYLYDTIKFNLEHDGPIELSTFAIAAWCEYLSAAVRGNDNKTATTLVAYDANLTHLLTKAREGLEDPSRFLVDNDAFDSELAANSRFKTTFDSMITLIRRDGIRKATEQITKASHSQTD